MQKEQYIQAITKKLMNVKTLAEQRAALDEIYLEHNVVYPYKLSKEIIAGVNCYWVNSGNAQKDKTILFFHGGGFTLGSTHGHLGLLSQLTQNTQMKILSVDYRLAPEHPYPAALHDVFKAYKFLLKQSIPADKILFAGITAGTNLSLALMLLIKANNLPLPKGAVFLSFSPRLDFEFNPERYQNRPDWINYQRIKQIVAAYLAGADPQDPYASPMYGDLHGLPTMLIQTGSHEITYQDALDFHQLAIAANIDAKLEVYPEMIHGWAMFPKLFPEAGQAINNVSEFLLRS